MSNLFELDKRIGAFCRENHVSLEGSMSGPLAAIQFGVKDVFHIAGHGTGFGSPTWLATQPAPAKTASAVTRLLDAGASMVGKTLTDELAYSLTGENVHYGTPLNSAASDRVPGGSSCGSAAAVASGLVDFALGTDCGGSVRLPASYCGIYGIRPTVDRVPLDGVIPFGPPFDVAGWFAREPKLLLEVGRILLDDHSAPRTLKKLLVATDAFAAVEPSVRSCLSDGIRQVADLTDQRRDEPLSNTGLAQWFDIFRIVQAASIWSNLGSWVTEAKPELGPGIKERFAWAAALEAQDVRKARARHGEIIEYLGDTIGEDTVVVLPTSPRVAPRKNTRLDDIEVQFRHHAMLLLCIAGLGGLPQVSIPIASHEGLPLGLSLIGSRGTDLALMQLARQLVVP